MSVRIWLTAIYEFSNKYKHKDGATVFVLYSIFSILFQQHMYNIYVQDFIFETRYPILAFKHDDMMKTNNRKENQNNRAHVFMI